MDEPRFDRRRIEEFLTLAGERLEGEWLLVGGCAAATWFEPARTTEDIDIFGLGGTQAERVALMDLAVSLALPVEVVSSTVDYLVRRVDGWRDRIVPLHRGSSATIYRPDATLFLLLKIGRLSEIDLGDCHALIDHCVTHGDSIDVERVRSGLDALPATDDDELRDRRARLAQRLGSVTTTSTFGFVRRPDGESES